MSVVIHFLGTLRITVDGLPFPVAWTRRTAQLLTYLYAAPAAVTRDAAAFAVWPDDDEETARGNLRRNLNVLRGLLPEPAVPWIIVEAGSIGFDHANAATDVKTFASLAADPATYAAAVAAYTGDFSETFDEPWVLRERDRLRARFHELLTELIGSSFSARRFDVALGYARRLAADEPLREDVVRRVIAIRYAMGDRPGAIAEFERFRSDLGAELGVVPMPETIALHDLILRGEPLPYAPDARHARQTTPVSDPPDGFRASGRALLPFGGRDAPLRQLQTGWIAASSGNGSAIMVSGDAGLGKTRLIAEFLERTVGTAARILRGTTTSPESRAYESLLGALTGAAPFVPMLRIEPVWLDVLAPLVPELAPFAAGKPTPELPPEREAKRLNEAFSRLLSCVAKARPVVVILEDLHWAGPGTLAAIRQLAFRIRSERILLIATYREDEGRAVEELRRDLVAAGLAEAIALDPLPPDVALNVVAQLPTPPPSEDARRLVERSDGNPLFLSELISDYPQSIHAATSGITEMVTARLATCTPNTRALVSVMAICGATCDFDTLRSVIGWSNSALLDGITELLGRHFIRATAGHERGNYAFTHALVRGAIAGQTDPDDRRRVHGIVARTLETRSGPGISAAEIAFHWREAREFERAAAAYAQAAKAARQAHAREDAAELAAAGESLTTDPTLRFELLRCRLDAQLNRVDGLVLRADADRLAAIARNLDIAQQYDAALLAYRVEALVGDTEARSRRVAALQAFVDETAEPWRAAEIAGVVAGDAAFRGDYPAVSAAAQRSQELYALAGDEAAALRAAVFICRINSRGGDLAGAERALSELEAPVSALGDLQVTMEYWAARATVPQSKHDGTAILYAAQRLADASRAAGDRLWQANALVLQATAHAHAVRLTHAFRVIDEAGAIFKELNATAAQNMVANNRASLLIQVGRVDEAAVALRDLLRRVEGIAETEYFALNNLGVARLEAGASDEARGFEQRALQSARRLQNEAYEALALSDLGLAEAACGDVADGIDHLREAAAINEKIGRHSARARDLARAARFEPDTSRAGMLAHEALTIIDADPTAYADVPEILANCAAAFERIGDARAATAARRRGRDLLEQHQSAIEDPDDRSAYAGRAKHRELLRGSHRSEAEVQVGGAAKAIPNIP